MPKDYEKYYPKYDDFPLVGLFNNFDFSNLDEASKTVSFANMEVEACFCYVDIVGSTKIGASLKNFELGQYIDRVLNPLGSIVESFGGIKNKTAGDSILFYFLQTPSTSTEQFFKKILDCCMTMLEAHGIINSTLSEIKLPPVNYRISADYGKVKLGKDEKHKTEEFFGTSVNMCAKINTMAHSNEMVVGGDLYHYVKSIPNYRFVEIEGYSINSKQLYPVYSVAKKINRPTNRRYISNSLGLFSKI